MRSSGWFSWSTEYSEQGDLFLIDYAMKCKEVFIKFWSGREWSYDYHYIQEWAKIWN